jgi:hypothetical protein
MAILERTDGSFTPGVDEKRGDEPRPRNGTIKASEGETVQKKAAAGSALALDYQESLCSKPSFALAQGVQRGGHAKVKRNRTNGCDTSIGG